MPVLVLWTLFMKIEGRLLQAVQAISESYALLRISGVCWIAGAHILPLMIMNPVTAKGAINTEVSAIRHLVDLLTTMKIPSYKWYEQVFIYGSHPQQLSKSLGFVYSHSHH
jgi:hypothetical protein